MDIQTSQSATMLRPAAGQQETDFLPLVTATVNGIFIIQDGLIVYANPAAIGLVGAESPDQVIGQPTTRFQHADFHEATRQRFAQVLRQVGPAPAMEQKLIRLDGEVIDVEVLSVAASYQGQPAIQAVMRNISPRKRLETALQTMGRLTQTMMRTDISRHGVLQTFLDVMSQSFSADGAALVLPTANGKHYVNGFTFGALAEPKMVALFSSEELTERIFSNRAIGSSSPQPPASPATYDEQLAQLAGLGLALAAVPLIAEQKTVAVLWLARRTPFDDFEFGLLDSIRAQAGINIQRAALADKLRQSLKRMESLQRIDRSINTSLDLQVTLNLLLEQVSRELDVDAVSILMVDELGNLRFKAGRGFRTGLIEKADVKLAHPWAGEVAMQRELVKIPLIKPSGTAALDELVAAEAFSSYFAAPLVSQTDLIGVLEIFHRQPLDPDQPWFDFLRSVAEQAAIAIRNADLFRNTQRAKTEIELAYEATLSGWVHALDLRDGETGAHTQRVTSLCLSLARAMQYPSEHLPQMWRGAMLHDIGKMAIPDSILRKPGALSEDEWAVMKTHPALARNLLAPIEFLRSAIDIPYYHHEKWDGSGYPEGLAGVHIPLEARIFAVADVWDALRSDRPYRAAWSDQQALDHIREQKGKAFDPNVVDVFEKMIAAGTASGDST